MKAYWVHKHNVKNVDTRKKNWGAGRHARMCTESVMVEKAGSQASPRRLHSSMEELSGSSSSGVSGVGGAGGAVLTVAAAAQSGQRQRSLSDSAGRRDVSPQSNGNRRLHHKSIRRMPQIIYYYKRIFGCINVSLCRTVYCC